MIPNSVVDAPCLTSSQGSVTKQVRRITLTVLAIGLLVGAAGMRYEPRLGIFGTALILGWTQLVGL